MAVAALEVKKIMDNIPTKGVILIRPYPNSLAANDTDKNKTWGYVKRTGLFTIKKQPVEEWGYPFVSLAIHGNGVNLNMENEEHRLMFAIFSNADQWIGVISKTKDQKYPGSRFYFENPEMEAQKYLEGVRAGDEMVDMIRSLNNMGLESLALWFGIKGSLDVVRASLRKKTETTQGRKDLGEILLSPDRELLELISFAESKGVPAEKKGLWLNKTSSIYYWNLEAIGIGKDSVVTYLKKNPDIQSGMRQIYLGQTVAQIQESEKPKGPVAESHKPVVKVTGKSELKYEGTATDEQIITAYNEGEKDPAGIGRKFNMHWRKVKKVLDNNTDKLKED